MSPSEWLKDPRKRGQLVLAIAIALAIALVWPLAVGRDARHLTAYRAGDEDLSRFHAELVAEGFDVRSIRSTPHLLDDVEDPARSLLVIVGAERRYDASEAAVVIDFLRAGGSVLLADESGFGTDIARAAGFAFSSERVIDTVSRYKGDAQLPVATVRLGPDAYDVLFNSPSSIIALSDAQPHDVLAASSEDDGVGGSYLDQNANGEVDLSDPAGPFPLVVRTAVGSGALVLVADTGVFMNEQMGVAEYDNAKLVRALVATLASTGSTVLVDESRHAPTPLLAPWGNGVRTLGRLTSGPLVPFVTLAVLVALVAVVWRLTRKTDDWSHHRHDVGTQLPLSPEVRPDVGRLQRMARRRISEKYNIPLEQVAAMRTEELLALTSDRALSEAAGGNVRGDPAPLFRSFSDPSPEAHP